MGKGKGGYMRPEHGQRTIPTSFHKESAGHLMPTKSGSTQKQLHTPTKAFSPTNREYAKRGKNAL